MNSSNKIITILVIAILLVTGITAYQQVSTKSNSNQYLQQASYALNHMSISVKVTVTNPSGKVVGQTYQPNDLITQNFENWTSNFFSNSYTSFDLLDSTNAHQDNMIQWGNQVGTATCSGGNTNSCTIYGYGGSGVLYTGGMIAIGTSNTAPTRTDYKLGALYIAYAPITSSSWNTSPTCCNITLGASITANNSTTIQEVGYFEQWPTYELATTSAQPKFLMFHDNGIGLSVIANDVVSVIYTLILPVGFTNSFGNILTQILSNSNNGPTYAPAGTVTKISGATYGANTFNVYGHTSTCGAGCLGAYTSQTALFPNFMIAVGTANTVFAVTQYTLTPVGSYVTGAATLYTSINTLTLASTVTGLTGQNIQEFGLFMAFGVGTTQSLYVMIYRSVISGTLAPIGITVALSLGF